MVTARRMKDEKTKCSNRSRFKLLRMNKHHPEEQQRRPANQIPPANKIPPANQIPPATEITATTTQSEPLNVELETHSQPETIRKSHENCEDLEVRRHQHLKDNR